MNKIKHVLIFTKEFHHPQISKSGGTGIFYKTLATELLKRNIQLTVFGSHRDKVDFEENGIRFKFVKDYFKKNKILELLRSLSGKIRLLRPLYFRLYIQEKKYLVDELKYFVQQLRIKPDIIETHDWEGISMFMDSLNIPYVVRYHGSWNVLVTHFDYNSSPGKMYCEKIALQQCENNIVISRFSEKINQELYQIQNPQLIYNGIDSDFFLPSANPVKIPHSIFILGEISKEKGAYTALEAFLMIHKKFPQATLHFIGNEGKHKQKLKEIAGNKLSEHLIFHGRKSPEEFIKLLSQAEIMFFPSKGENFSLSLLEAMALEKAVVTSKIPAFEEIIENGKNGLIAENANDFFIKTELLFKNPELRKKIELAAGNTVRKKFNINRMVEETISFYNKIICKI